MIELKRLVVQTIEPSVGKDLRTMSELEQYAGCDGWAAMLRHERQIPQFPFISYRKLQNGHQL